MITIPIIVRQMIPDTAGVEPTTLTVGARRADATARTVDEAETERLRAAMRTGERSLVAHGPGVEDLVAVES